MTVVFYNLWQIIVAGSQVDCEYPLDYNISVITSKMMEIFLL